MSGSWSENGEDLAADAHSYVAAVEAAIAAVEAWGRGRPIAEIESGLVRELRAKRAFMGPEEINLEARRISDPDWAVKDPETARRPVVELRSPEARAAESAFRQECEQTIERLAEAASSMRRVRRTAVTSHRTVDGVEYEIRIDPWTRRRADKLQRIAAPRGRLGQAVGSSTTIRDSRASAQTWRSALTRWTRPYERRSVAAVS